MANLAAALNRALLLNALLVASSVFMASAYSSAVPAAMMVDCFRCDGGVDGTKWVRSGLYRLDTSDAVQTLVRKKPLVLGGDENDPLVEATIRAMSTVGEDGDSAVLEAQWPNLTRRARYTYSLFMAQDQLLDIYNVYVRVGRNKYVIVMGRDTESGEFMLIPGEGRLINRYGTEGKPRDLEQFGKVEAAAGR